MSYHRTSTSPPRTITKPVPQSAPPHQKATTHLFLTSPETARRSRDSLEAVRVARTLKEGFNRLKAIAHPPPSRRYNPIQRKKLFARPALTLSQSASSATTTEPMNNPRISRHHSSTTAQPTTLYHTKSCPAREPPRPRLELSREGMEDVAEAAEAMMRIMQADTPSQENRIGSPISFGKNSDVEEDIQDLEDLLNGPDK